MGRIDRHLHRGNLVASTKPIGSVKPAKAQLDPLDLVRWLVRSYRTRRRCVQSSVARFVDDKVIPVIRDAFEQHYFPKDLVPQIAELGLLGSSIDGYDCAGLNTRLLWVDLPGARARRQRHKKLRIGSKQSRYVSDSCLRL